MSHVDPVEVSTLEPTLTKWDQSVLETLGVYPPIENWDPNEPLEWKSAWQVAEELREEDVALVRRTLNGLENFGYAVSLGNTRRRHWLRHEKRVERRGCR